MIESTQFDLASAGKAIALVVVIAAAAVATWHYGRRSSTVRRPPRLSLLGVRLLALGGVLLLLVGGRATQPPTDGDPADNRPTVAVLIDTSASMAASSPGVEPSRFAVMTDRWVDAADLDRLADAANIRWYAFDATVRAVGAPPERADRDALATRLFAGIDQVGEAADAIWLLSDGHDTSGATADSRTTGMASAPVFTSLAGDATEVPDLALTLAVETDRVFANQPVRVAILARRLGPADQPLAAPVALQRDGEPAVMAHVRFEPNQRSARVEMTDAPPTTDAPRLLRYVARIEPTADEQNAANNVDTAVVQQVGRRIHVLLLEGEPHWETRFLSDALRADAQVALTAVHAIGPQRVSIRVDQADDGPNTDAGGVANTRGGPRPNDANATGVGRDSTARTGTDWFAAVAPEGLGGYDVIVLGRRVDRLLDAQQVEALRQRLIDGGGLLFARGPAGDTADADADGGDPLDALAPVQWGRRIIDQLRLDIGPGGEALGVPDEATLHRLPHLLAVTRARADRAATVVALLGAADGPDAAGGVGQSQAVLVYQPIGAGRVMANLGEGFWRWAMRGDQPADAAAAYRGLVAGMIRYLALGEAFEPGGAVTLSASRLNAEAGESIELRVDARYLPADHLARQMRLQVTDPAGRQRRLQLAADAVQPTRAVATFTPDMAGAWRVQLTGDASVLDAPPPPPRLVLNIAPAGDELTDTTPRPDVLASISQASGGVVLEGGDLTPLIDYLRDRTRRPNAPTPTPGSTPTSSADMNGDGRPRWMTWPVLVAIVGLLSGEWFARRRMGLS